MEKTLGTDEMDTGTADQAVRFGRPMRPDPRHPTRGKKTSMEGELLAPLVLKEERMYMKRLMPQRSIFKLGRQQPQMHVLIHKRMRRSKTQCFECGGAIGLRSRSGRPTERQSHIL